MERRLQLNVFCEAKKMDYPKKQTVKIGLVLTGGGARAAYQVGVLRAISVITKIEKMPFAIVSGFSAGAINGTWLASRFEDFDAATKSMWDAWASMTTDRVFTTDSISLARIAVRWLKDRSFGGFMNRKSQINFLLDTSPLENFVKTHIDFDALNEHLAAQRIHAVAVTAANYRSGHSTVFYNGNPKIQDWRKFNRISVRSAIKSEFVMASAAIPIFFPPILVGNSYYGDGMIRLNAPLSSAIHMGAEKLLIIGIRGPRPAFAASEAVASISLSEIAGTILNGLFFDSLDADIDRMQRVNRTLAVMSAEELLLLPDQLRKIPMLYLKPTEEIADLPENEMTTLPPSLSYVLRGIGVTPHKGKDLLSYLSFEGDYMQSLLKLGYEDTIRKKDRILEFFEEDFG